MRRGQTGISLLECLIALAILAIAITAAYRSIGITTSQQPELRERLLAEWIAQDRLAQHRIANYWTSDINNAEGNIEQGGQTFTWKEEYKSTPNPGFRSVEIQVMRPGSDHALAQMRGFITQ